MLNLAKTMSQRTTQMSSVIIGLAVASLGMIFALSPVVMGSASASPRSHTTSQATALKRGLAFYAGKTISYYVAGGAGTGKGNQIIALQPAMEAYLHATINIIYVNGANNIAQNQVASSAPDGLTLGVMLPISNVSSTITTPGTSPINFAMSKMSIAGAIKASPAAFVACGSNPPFSTLAQVLTTTTPLVWVNQTLVASTVQNHIFQLAYRLNGKFLEGYTSTSGPVGCQRGDGNITSGSATTFLNAAENAEVPGMKVLALTGPMPAASPAAFLNGEVPTLSKFIKQHPPVNRAAKKAMEEMIDFFAADSPQYATYGPAGVPKDRLLALQMAMKAAMKQGSVLQQLLLFGNPGGYITPQTVKNWLTAQHKNGPYFQQVLGITPTS